MNVHLHVHVAILKNWSLNYFPMNLYVTESTLVPALSY